MANKQIINYDPVAAPTETDLLLSQPAAGGIYATYTPAQLATIIPPRGTSFPGSPSTGDMFYRKDLREIAYYDGTRWVGNPFALPLANYSSFAADITSTGTIYGAALPGFDTYLVAAYVAIFCNTVDASNYWTINVRLRDSSGSSSNIASFDVTSPLAWDKTTLTSFSTNPLDEDDQFLSLYVVKTSSPSNLNVMTTILARRVFT